MLSDYWQTDNLNCTPNPTFAFVGVVTFALVDVVTNKMDGRIILRKK
jgi:hypothetical protein